MCGLLGDSTRRCLGTPAAVARGSSTRSPATTKTEGVRLCSRYETARLEEVPPEWLRISTSAFLSERLSSWNWNPVAAVLQSTPFKANTCRGKGRRDRLSVRFPTRRWREQQSVATSQTARERAHPPCRHSNNQSCCLGSAFEVAAFQTQCFLIDRPHEHLRHSTLLAESVRMRRPGKHRCRSAANCSPAHKLTSCEQPPLNCENAVDHRAAAKMS
jgi:hypothetical protein